MDIEVKCNHCNNFYDVDEAHTGQEIDCPDCGKKIIIQPHQRKETIPSPHPTPQSEDGLLLGLYRLEGEVAEGGMGKVFKVHHTGWNVDLAMKQPHPEMFETEAQKQTFTHECEAWINLGLHPHIVSCYYVREIDGVPNIFAEWMEGGDLAHWIESRQLYEGDEKDILERILDIAIQFAWGLDYAHENGLIHQDVKPENVMLTPEGDVKIADFGIANAICGIAESNAETVQFGGTMMSDSGAYTPAYCSPEQANGQKLTRRTDIWSWAVSVMEMLLGERSWTSGVIAGTACDEYFEQAMLTIPVQVKSLLKECFQEKESDRPNNFKHLSEDLIKIYKEETGTDFVKTYPKAAEDSPDSLNNRALSYVDMGKIIQAEELWDKALQLDPHHLDSTYNRGLYLWRNARIDDVELVRQLEEIRITHDDSWRDEYLLGLIHLERHDEEKAIELLEEATEQSNGNKDVKQALALARNEQKTVPTFVGHSARITSVALSPDGRFCLSGSEDNTLKLWELKTGKCIRTFTKHSDKISSVAFSPDSHFFLSGSYDGTVKMWDVASGECLRTYKGDLGYSSVYNINLNSNGRYFLSQYFQKYLLWNVATGRFKKDWGVFSPDGQYCLSKIENNVLQLLELETGKYLRTFEGHSDRISSISFNADSNCFLSGSYDNTIKMWHVRTGKCLKTFLGHSETITSVSLSPDGRFCLSQSKDYVFKLWEIETGKCVRTLEGYSGAEKSIAFSPDGQYLLAGNEVDALKLWNLKTGQCIWTFHGHSDFVKSVAFSPDGKYCLSGSYDSIKLWDVGTGKCLRTVEAEPDVVITFSLDGQHYLSEIYENKLRLWEVACFYSSYYTAPDMLSQISNAGEMKKQDNQFLEILSKIEYLYSKNDITSALDLLMQARKFPGRKRNKTIISWQNKLGEKCIKKSLTGGWTKQIFKVDTGGILCVDFSPDGEKCLSGGFDDSIRLWDLETGECIQTFDGNSEVVESVSFSADGKFCLSGNSDNSLKLWDLESGECLRTFEEHTDMINSVAFSPDNRYCLSGSDDESLKLWDVKTGECIRTFKGHSDFVKSVAFSPQGKYCLSGSWDYFLKLWNIETGECIRSFEGHSDAVESIAFSPDGRYCLSGSEENTLLWDVRTGKCIWNIEGGYPVTFTPDGNYCFSGNEDGESLKLWDLATRKCILSLDEGITSIAISPDGRYLLLLEDESKNFKSWELDWEYTFPGWADWDDGAEPYLQNFLALRNNQWKEEDFELLIKDLQNRGYGWLRPEGVRKKLIEMTDE